MVSWPASSATPARRARSISSRRARSPARSILPVAARVVTRSSADDSVAALRFEAGRSPSDRPLSDLVGELATRSEEFAARGGRHDVRVHRTASKRLNNDVVGELELTGDALDLPIENDSIDVAAQNCLFNVFRQEHLARALAEMHRRRVAHGNLKPGNVFLTNTEIGRAHV